MLLVNRNRPWIFSRSGAPCAPNLMIAGSLRMREQRGSIWQSSPQVGMPLVMSFGSEQLSKSSQSTRLSPSSSIPLLQSSSFGGSQSSPGSNTSLPQQMSSITHMSRFSSQASTVHASPSVQSTGGLEWQPVSGSHSSSPSQKMPLLQLRSSASLVHWSACSLHESM